MNQFKFRGKRKDNGEWVYGLLVMGVFKDTMIQVNDDDYYSCVVVIPETVGMWTGLKDKNGSELYQGDIYKSEHFPSHHFVIMFINGAFVGGKNEDICSPIGWVDEDQSNQEWICKVGNIYDHPHLNPASGQSGINNMLDPNEKQAAEGQEATTETLESASQDKAMEVDSEEGTTEG